MQEATSEASVESIIGRRVAFFGGSFDPPHLGHLAIARAARDALGLDTVLFAPVGVQPLKPHGSTARFQDRLALTQLAIAGEPGFAVTLADAPKPSGAPNFTPNFTIDTLLSLRAQLPPGGVLFCLMGADSFFELRHWHRAAEIPFVAQLIVASRPGQQPELLIADLEAALPPGLTIEAASGSNSTSATNPAIEIQSYVVHNSAGQAAFFYLLPGLDVEISASQIRDQIRDQIREQPRDQSPNRLLPDAVFAAIRTRGLYR